MSWEDKALENEEKWGSQSIQTLLMCMSEELGEVNQAFLEWRDEDGDWDEIQAELDDLAALCHQLDWRINEADDPTVIRCTECGFPIDQHREDFRMGQNGAEHTQCPVEVLHNK